MQRGFSPVTAAAQARGVLASLVDQQANLLAFLDCFLLLIPVALAGEKAPWPPLHPENKTPRPRPGRACALKTLPEQGSAAFG